MQIKIAKTDEATWPARGSMGATGWDIASAESVVIKPRQTKKVGTGLHMAIPDFVICMVFPRSGLSIGEDVLIHPGLIDPDYRGEIKIVIRNIGSKKIIIEKGQRIAQMIFFNSVVPITFMPSKELGRTVRGSGGFGSTGKL